MPSSWRVHFRETGEVGENEGKVVGQNVIKTEGLLDCLNNLSLN